MGFSDEMKGMCETLGQSRSDRDKAMKELHSASRQDRMERMAAIKRTAGDVKRLFGDVHVLIQHFHTDRGKMSKELRAMLEGYFEGIQKDVRGFLREFRTQHKAMSGKQQEELEAFCNGLRREVSHMRKQFRSEHKATSEKQHEALRGFCSGLRREVNQMRRSFQQTQRALHADFQKAHGLWMEFAGRMQKARTGTKPRASSLQARITSTLKGSPEGMTPKELSYAIGTPEKGLNRALARMRRQRHIRKRKSTFFAP